MDTNLKHNQFDQVKSKYVSPSTLADASIAIHRAFGRYTLGEILKDSVQGLVCHIRTKENDHVIHLPNSPERKQSLRWQKTVIDKINQELIPEVYVPSIEILEYGTTLLAAQPRVVGESLSSEAYSELTDREREKLADEIVRFVSLLHVTPESFLDTAMTQRTPKRAESYPLKRVGREQLVFGRDAREMVEEFNKSNFVRASVIFERCIRYCETSSDVPDEVFGHFDLHGYNILIDPGRGRIAGIIDFENCERHDRALEFCRFPLVSTELLDQIERKYTAYGHTALERGKIDAYYGLFLGHLLDANLRTRNEQGANGIDGLFAKYDWQRVEQRA